MSSFTALSSFDSFTILASHESIPAKGEKSSWPPSSCVHCLGHLETVVDDPFFPPDELQRELTTTRHLLGELGIGSSEDNVKAFEMMRELREVIQKKDLELRRYCRK